MIGKRTKPGRDNGEQKAESADSVERLRKSGIAEFCEGVAGSEEPIRDAILREAFKKTAEKFGKPNQNIIVEEEPLAVQIVLEVEGNQYPKVEVTVDRHLLGYINATANDNEGRFTIECHKRGNGHWDEKRLRIAPLGVWSRYYHIQTKRIRLSPRSAGEEVLMIYVPMSLRRNLFGWKRRPPALQQPHYDNGAES